VKDTLHVASDRLCIELHQPGALDPTCPTGCVAGGFGTFPGCRRTDGSCGVLAEKVGGLFAIGLGCVGRLDLGITDASQSGAGRRRVYTMRMPRVQVYLPEALAREVKRRKLSPSTLLQNAVRNEIERRELVVRHEKYLRDLRREVGEPTRADREYAEAIARRLRRRSVKKTG